MEPEALGRSNGSNRKEKCLLLLLVSQIEGERGVVANNKQARKEASNQQALLLSVLAITAS